MHSTTMALTTVLSLASAAPASLEARFPTSRGNNVLPPSAISIYHSSNGAIDYGVRRSEVSCKDWNGRDNSTLVTFDINGRTLPKKCNLRSCLEPNTQSSNPGSGHSVSGTGLIDIFSSLQPTPVGGSKGRGGPGNQRNDYLCRVKVQNQDAAIDASVPSQLEGTNCPKAGDWNIKNGLVGYELVPVGGADRVQWDAAVSGLYLKW